MAQRVVLLVLWLVNRSFGGFPNQINIGKWQRRFWALLNGREQTRRRACNIFNILFYSSVPARLFLSAAAMRNDNLIFKEAARAKAPIRSVRARV